MQISLWLIGFIALVALIAGATASIVGFGIGSLLTPIIAARFGADIAIGAVALPHLAGGLMRGWQLRRSIDWNILLRFGILSATGGLIGALAFARLAPDVLGRILGVLLVMTAAAGLTRLSERWRPQGIIVWVLGALSGFFGGIVGNQGGLRAAALTAFKLEPTVFVATSTVIGIMIDIVRTPVYLNRAAYSLGEIKTTIIIMIIGVLMGTLIGKRLLLGLTRERFKQVVLLAVGALGLWFLFH